MGANGGVSGSDMRVIKTYPGRKVDIRSVDNHQISSIPLSTAGGVTATITGEVIVIKYQHACHDQNKTIHSYPQIEHYKKIVDYLSIKVGGVQHIPPWISVKHASIWGALPYMNLRPYTDE